MESGIRTQKSLESGIQEPGIRNPETRNPESGAWNPESTIRLDSLTWGEKYFKSETMWVCNGYTEFCLFSGANFIHSNARYSVFLPPSIKLRAVSERRIWTRLIVPKSQRLLTILSWLDSFYFGDYRSFDWWEEEHRIIGISRCTRHALWTQLVEKKTPLLKLYFLLWLTD